MQSMIRDLPFSNRTFQQRECAALSTPSSECLATTCHLLELTWSHLKSLRKGSHPWGDAEGADLCGPFSPAHHPVGRKLPPPPDALTPCSLPRCTSPLQLGPSDGYPTLQYPGASITLLFLGLSGLSFAPGSSKEFRIEMLRLPLPARPSAKHSPYLDLDKWQAVAT